MHVSVSDEPTKCCDSKDYLLISRGNLPDASQATCGAYPIVSATKIVIRNRRKAHDSHPTSHSGPVKAICFEKDPTIDSQELCKSGSEPCMP